MTDDLSPRTITEDEYRAVHRLVFRAFFTTPTDELAALDRPVLELDRTHAVFADGAPVATGTIQTRELSIPGGTVQAAHVTGVAVAPTYRRRGLLGKIMQAQFAAAAAAGEPVAALWASEGAIYGRYGYGPATWSVRYEADNREVSLAGPAGVGVPIREVEPLEGREAFAAVLDRARQGQPGLSGRPRALWERRLVNDPADRQAAAELQAVLAGPPGDPVGYALWRPFGNWGPAGAEGIVDVIELLATTLDGYAALWRFLLTMDLTRQVRYGVAGPGEPLPHLVADPRRLAARLGDGLWIRLIDLPAALAARRYAAPVDAVLEVTDQRIPANAGRWRLTAAGPDAPARCAATDAPADLTMDVRELGAAYLGGTSLGTLAAAGRVVEHRPGGLAAVATAFGWPVPPISIEVF
ncbi:GNAT family N-acetyltransferase [Plantactinospora siamensis]|uniref:GNAT family N-acetyltransferase n=1 Tax=Plantactinospora siamensis TaxID=555372 RepID=A0ABV6P1R6_9ACTN